MSKHRIRPAELAQLEFLSPGDLKRPRKLRSQRITDHQDKVFSLPELREIIAGYLTKSSTCALASTCREWRAVWLPVLLSRFALRLDSRTLKSFPGVEELGKYVLDAQVHLSTDVKCRDIAHTLSRLPNLQSIYIADASWSFVQHDLISTLSTSLRQIEVYMLYSEPWPRHALTRLHNLQVLKWTKGSVLDEDIMASLRASPQLQHLCFSSVSIDDGPDDVSVTEIEMGTSLSTQLDPYIGTQIRRLQLNECEISDKALLRLLGIDMVPTHRVSARASHALAYLHVRLTGYRHATYKSTARILEECPGLRHLDLEDTGAVSPELFLGDAPWPCARTLEHLAIQIMPAEQERPPHGDIGVQFHGSAGDLTAQQQQRIFRRIKRFTGLRRLDLTGYPMGLAALEDMAFAKDLERSRIQLRTTNRDTVEEHDRIAELGHHWLRRQPVGWECKMHGSFNGLYLLSFDKTRGEKSEKVERLG